MASDRGRERASRGTQPPALQLSCEHGGNLVPGEWAGLFAGKERLLHSHRGWDPGALELAGTLASSLRAPLCFALVSRLVMDLNRSIDNPGLWSSLTASLPEHDRRRILRSLYAPYRRHIERSIRRLVRAQRPVVHVSVHTFTPVLRGRTRTVDIGILFDPSRSFEASIAAEWRRGMRRHLPRLRVRFNQPYRGTDDGLTTHLRTLWPDTHYAGIELEVSQKFARRRGRGWDAIKAGVAQSLAVTLQSVAPETGR